MKQVMTNSIGGFRRINSVKFVIFALLSAALCCSPLALAAGIGGVWEGESICTIKDSPCHDEHVIYTITEPDSNGNLTIQADKVVNGQREDMGTLECTFDEKNSKINCPMSKGTWEFYVNGIEMKGTLKLADGRLYRNISVKKRVR